jgi:beta-lactamase class A
MAATLRHLVLGSSLSPASRATFISWLVGCQTGANRLRAGLPSNWVIGDKTGNNGKDAAGDIAVAWPKPDTPIVICAYTRDGSPTSGQLDDVFRDIGRYVAAHLS